jgi:hypothetical protein
MQRHPLFRVIPVTIFETRRLETLSPPLEVVAMTSGRSCSSFLCTTGAETGTVGTAKGTARSRDRGALAFFFLPRDRQGPGANEFSSRANNGTYSTIPTVVLGGV